MQRTGYSFFWLWAASLAFVSSGLGQENAKQLLSAAYAKTKDAQTVDDFHAIIDLCQQAQSLDLTPASSKYSKQLLSWALNRRGEAYVEQAAGALEGGDADRAADLDKRALADFEAAIKEDPTRWKAFHNRGVSKAVAGEYEQAVEDFSKVIELKPDYANAWFNRGEIRYELAQHEQAIDDYSKAIELDPTDASAVTSRGHARVQLKQLAAALADYTRAIELDRGNADALVNRGDAYLALQNWSEAAADYRQAIALDENSGRAYRSAAWLMATCPDHRFRNVEIGVQAAERAVQLLGAEDLEALDAMAAAYANAERFAEAAETVAKAIKLAAGKDVDVLTTRLELYSTDKPYRLPKTETALIDAGTESR